MLLFEDLVFVTFDKQYKVILQIDGVMNFGENNSCDNSFYSIILKCKNGRWPLFFLIVYSRNHKCAHQKSKSEDIRLHEFTRFSDHSDRSFCYITVILSDPLIWIKMIIFKFITPKIIMNQNKYLMTSRLCAMGLKVHMSRQK